MQTSQGTFTITLDQKDSPNVTASFAALVRKRYFDGTIFHRIVPGFLIQGGDRSATGHGYPGYTVRDKPPATTKYTAGVVAMAKTTVQPAGTAGSQFFIVTAANAGLTPDYAIVGAVVKGLAVVDRIGRLGDQGGEPTETVELERATLRSSA